MIKKTRDKLDEKWKIKEGNLASENILIIVGFI